MSAELDALRRRFDGHEPGLMGARREFAVLCPLVEKEDGLHFLFEVRSADLPQGGEVCFPGGRKESGESFLECALRETEEEIGIPRESIQVLGKSDFVLTIYRGMIQPFVGFVPYEVYQNAKPNPEEVEAMFTVPLKFFMETEPDKYDTVWKVIQSDDFPYERIEGGKNYPFSKNRTTQLFYEYDGYTIWGFTAQVIRNIVDILKAKEIEK